MNDIIINETCVYRFKRTSIHRRCDRCVFQIVFNSEEKWSVYHFNRAKNSTPPEKYDHMNFDEQLDKLESQLTDLPSSDKVIEFIDDTLKRYNAKPEVAAGFVDSIKDTLKILKEEYRIQTKSDISEFWCWVPSTR